MKMKSKALLLSLCAVMLVVASVMGTMAYLTAQDTVQNTFTVGKVGLTLDETTVYADGTLPTTSPVPTHENEYHLLPGHKYVKDPTVHVTANSEDSYLFVKVENGIAAYEADEGENGYTPIAKQIEANGWIPLEVNGETVEGVYWKLYGKNSVRVDEQVFGEFRIGEMADTVRGWADITAENTKVIVTAYAVQMDGFTDAADAWVRTFGA